ncbi:MAG: response regulator [Pseudomonadota bacterium]
MPDQKNVLIVDDSMLSRSLLVSNIGDSQPEWQVEQAASGDEALKVITNKSFDYYILDYNMPGLNGIQLAEKIKDKYAEAKIALCTANIQSSIQKKATEIDLYVLNKPVIDNELNVFFDQDVQ